LKDETVVGTNSIILAWQPSATAGGTAINRYTVTIDPPNLSNVSSFLLDVAGTIPPFYTLPITSLAAGTTYDFTVVARNASSISSPGDNTEALQTLEQGGPAPPTNLRADEAIPATPTTITAKWDSAFRNGGAKIAFYNLYVRGPEIDDNYTILAPLTSYTVADLTPDTSYSVSIAATNSNELSSPISAAITLTTDLEDGPAQPAFIDRAGTPPPNDNSNISVAWNTASTDGGTDISGYQVTWSPVPIK
jgi:chitodextrinase